MYEKYLNLVDSRLQLGVASDESDNKSVVTNHKYLRKIITHSSNPRNGQDRCCHKEWIRKKSVLDFSPPDRLVKQTLSLAGLDSFEGHTLTLKKSEKLFYLLHFINFDLTTKFC